LMVRPSQKTAAGELLAGWELVDLDHGELKDLDERESGGLFERSSVVDGIRFRSSEDLLRLVCFHFLRQGGRRPLWLCDIAAALESQPNNFDGRTKARAIARCATLAHDLLGACVGFRVGSKQWGASSAVSGGVREQGTYRFIQPICALNQRGGTFRGKGSWLNKQIRTCGLLVDRARTFRWSRGTAALRHPAGTGQGAGEGRSRSLSSSDGGNSAIGRRGGNLQDSRSRSARPMPSVAPGMRCL
jgi:hypothetical protein